MSSNTIRHRATYRWPHPHAWADCLKLNNSSVNLDCRTMFVYRMILHMVLVYWCIGAVKYPLCVCCGRCQLILSIPSLSKLHKPLCNYCGNLDVPIQAYFDKMYNVSLLQLVLLHTFAKGPGLYYLQQCSMLYNYNVVTCMFRADTGDTICISLFKYIWYAVWYINISLVTSVCYGNILNNHLETKTKY